ncbi:MAG: hypothetical protein F6J87_12185 [Spirulina sp. SIO3F2]|nr:hypothetical protein [Spirulina sp. SIO3F2]
MTKDEKPDQILVQNSRKPLLYIIPGNNFRAQDANISATFNDLAVSDESKSDTDGSQWKSTSVKIGTAIASVALASAIPVAGGVVATLLVDTLRSAIQNDSESSSQGDIQAIDVERVLDKFSIDNWSAFVEQTSYLEVPDAIKFPPGHPLPGRLYRSHPLSSKSDQYIPIEVFDSLLYAEREAELIRLLVDLGATRILIQDISNRILDMNVKAGVEIPGAGGVSGETGVENNVSENFSREFKLQGKNWSESMTVDTTKYSWLQYEPSWAAVTHARIHGGCLSSSIELHKDSSYSISSEIGLAEGLLKNIASADIAAALSKKEHEKKIIHVEFLGTENL